MSIISIVYTSLIPLTQVLSPIISGSVQRELEAVYEPQIATLKGRLAEVSAVVDYYYYIIILDIVYDMLLQTCYLYVTYACMYVCIVIRRAISHRQRD